MAADTDKRINVAREEYRPVATRGSLIYFLVDTLNVIDHMYQFSLAAFNFIYSKVTAPPTPRHATPCQLRLLHLSCHMSHHPVHLACIEGARQGQGE